jgi:hypothetical protein
MEQTEFSGDAANFLSAPAVTVTNKANRILIFSLLKIRKKTSSILAGITIGVACLWGVSLWQNIPPRELFTILLSTMVFLLAIILCALLIIAAFKLGAKGLSRLFKS